MTRYLCFVPSFEWQCLPFKVNHDAGYQFEKKNKLLRYSVPRTNDEGKEFVDVRFFPNEAGDMIWQLLAWGNDINIEEDYFSILKQNREDKK